MGYVTLVAIIMIAVLKVLCAVLLNKSDLSPKLNIYENQYSELVVFDIIFLSFIIAVFIFIVLWMN